MASIKKLRNSAANKIAQVDTPENRGKVKELALNGAKAAGIVVGVGVGLGIAQAVAVKTYALLS